MLLNNRVGPPVLAKLASTVGMITFLHLAFSASAPHQIFHRGVKRDFSLLPLEEAIQGQQFYTFAFLLKC